MARNELAELPHACPFSFRRLNESLFLIREHDNYGQIPNIYAKICTAEFTASGNPDSTVIVLSDTGCATSVKNPEFDTSATPQVPEYWNLRTVLEFTINPGERIPYLVMTTHCHFDHIMGIGLLPPTDGTSHSELSTGREGPPTTVLSSAYDPSFIDPWKNLCTHSLAGAFHLHAPYYTIGIWAQDYEMVNYSSPTISTPISTGFMTIHTPGHTPDSLTWYDTSSNLICVGDSFYEIACSDTETSKWGPERRCPILFEEKSDLATWWKSLDKLLQFVQAKNNQLEQQRPGSSCVAICASHSTTTSPDAEAYLRSIRTFMSRILRDEVPNKGLPDSPMPFKEFWLWDYQLATEMGTGVVKQDPAEAGFEWMVEAPKRIIDEGRSRIPKDEWTES